MGYRSPVGRDQGSGMKLSHPFVVLGLVAMGAVGVAYLTGGRTGEAEMQAVAAGPAQTAVAPAASPPPPPPPRTYPSDATPEEVEAATALVVERLKDPESARIRNVRVMKEGGIPVCGEVNARNGFGGYTGYSHFVIMEGSPGSRVVWVDSSDEAIAAAACSR